MDKLKWLGVLIGVAMVIIAGFQAYWLRDNYNREKATLIAQTDIQFREAIRTIQESTIQRRMRVLLRDTAGRTISAAGRARPSRRGPQPGRFVNVIRRSLRQDSLNRLLVRPRVFVNLEGSTPSVTADSLRMRGMLDSLTPAVSEVHVVTNKSAGQTRTTELPRRRQFLYPDTSTSMTADTGFRSTQSGILYIDNDNGDRITIRIDSLFNDTLAMDTLQNAIQRNLAPKYPGVSFNINWTAPDTGSREFRHPDFDPEQRYKLVVGNETGYLLRKIMMPILFSLFLVGLTLFSFILLYRSLARQQRLARIKNDFISNMTHELKTPIATVGVAIEALRDFNAMKDPEKTKEYLEISRLELQRLGLLVDKVLRQSMFEAKKMEFSREMVNLEELARNVIQSLRLQLEKSGATINLVATGDLHLFADRFHLVSVLLNLIDNSIKYSASAPAIDVILHGSEQEVRIEVADNGIGIPGQYQSKVFEKFFRVPAGNRHNAKGHGLGLSYVAEVVKEHSGTITVVSEAGSGSRFIITLPKQNRQA